MCLAGAIVGCVGRMYAALRPGGVLMVEDIDCSGCFCYSDHQATRRSIELYVEAARRWGGDPNIGPSLPALMLEAGFTQVGINVVQPAGLEGEVKIVLPLTLENIAHAILADALCTREELEHLLAHLYQFANDSRTVAGLPRVVQAWGYRGSYSGATEF
jgi:hypothetical protein